MSGKGCLFAICGAFLGLLAGLIVTVVLYSILDAMQSLSGESAMALAFGMVYLVLPLAVGAGMIGGGVWFYKLATRDETNGTIDKPSPDQ